MVSNVVYCWLICGLLVGLACTSPVSSGQQIPRVSELTSRLGGHSPHLQDSRLLPPLPSVQELEAIKKVADILVMLGQQVIPAIIGEPPSPAANCDTDEDPVTLDRQT